METTSAVKEDQIFADLNPNSSTEKLNITENNDQNVGKEDANSNTTFITAIDVNHKDIGVPHQKVFNPLKEIRRQSTTGSVLKEERRTNLLT